MGIVWHGHIELYLRAAWGSSKNYAESLPPPTPHPNNENLPPRRLLVESAYLAGAEVSVYSTLRQMCKMSPDS